MLLVHNNIMASYSEPTWIDYLKIGAAISTFGAAVAYGSERSEDFYGPSDFGEYISRKISENPDASVEGMEYVRAFLG